MQTEQQNTIYSAIIGAWNFNVIALGFSDDVDAMQVGWLYSWHHERQEQNRVIGLTWDNTRILVDIGQPLTAQEVMILLEAGFIVDESFYP